MDYDYYIDGLHKSDLLRPHVHHDNEALTTQFFRSAAYAGLQQPVSGVVQMFDHVSGTNVLPKVQFINPCERAEFGTVSWHVQQFGAMAGVTMGLLALNKGVGASTNLFAGKIEDNVKNQGALAFRTIADSAATGFVHNGLFRPVSDEEGNFYAARLKNGLVGAGTFATLTATTLGIKKFGEGQENMLGSIMRSNVGSTVLSGIPGGFAYAEMKSLADGNGPASFKQVGQAVYSFSVLGGAVAAGKELIGSTHAENLLNQRMKDSAAAASNRLKANALQASETPPAPAH